jgi:hypothetical protein
LTDDRVVNIGSKRLGGLKLGRSGDPAARKRAHNLATLAAQALLEGEAEELTRACIDKAKRGDSAALRIVMERILPPIRQRAIHVDLPHVASAADLRLAFDRILEAVAIGKMTPGEGLALCAPEITR